MDGLISCRSFGRLFCGSFHRWYMALSLTLAESGPYNLSIVVVGPIKVLALLPVNLNAAFLPYWLQHTNKLTLPIRYIVIVN